MQQWLDNTAFFRGGFRSFFAASGIFAIFAIFIWIVSNLLNIPINIDGVFSGVNWHRHEMIFGFVGSAICGFLLTAVPNWTNRQPLNSLPLLLLFIAWILARILNLTAPENLKILSASIDGGFYIALGIFIIKEVIKAKNRNIPIGIIIIAFGVLDAMDHFFNEDTNIIIYCAIASIITLISIIGGRIIPAFTRNYLNKIGNNKKLPVMPNMFDNFTIIFTGLSLLYWAIFQNNISGFFLIISSALQFIRLSRWCGEKTIYEKLVLILHVGYFFVPLGLLGLGFGALQIIPISAGIHTLTMGAMAVMILAVMTRASLGHTGRPLQSSVTAITSYIFLVLGTIFRVMGALDIFNNLADIIIAAIFWIFAYTLFTKEYLPYFLKPRL